MDCGFTSFGFAVSADKAVASAVQRCPDLITADVELSPGSGIEAVQTICANDGIPVIFITGRADEARVRMPQHSVLDTPFRVADVKTAVKRAMGI
jgi:CheY-like chemotaxis protein